MLKSWFHEIRNLLLLDRYCAAYFLNRPPVNIHPLFQLLTSPKSLRQPLFSIIFTGVESKSFLKVFCETIISSLDELRANSLKKYDLLFSTDFL